MKPMRRRSPGEVRERAGALPRTPTPRGAGAPPAGFRRALTESRRRSPAWLLLLVGAGIFFGTLDQTVVVTVLADILKDLRLPINRDLGKAPWVVTGYLLGYTIAMPIVGRVADVFGRVRVFAACLLIFCAGSVLTAIAPNFWFLVGARAFQAIGGGGLLPVGLAIAADVTRARRALALGALAAANNGSTFIGPVWGAAIAGVWGWRALFWLNLPLVLPMLAAAPLLARDTGSRGWRTLDWRGAALLIAGLTALTVALTDDGANPRPLAVSLALGSAGAVVMLLFVRTELDACEPMIDLRSLRTRPVAAAMLAYFLIGGALITALVNVPLMTDALYGQSTTQGGLNLMRLLLLLPIGGVAGGWLATRAGYRATVLIGLSLACAGFLWMGAWPFTPREPNALPPSTWHLWGALGLAGFGLGLCDGPIVATVVDAVDERQRATASALLLVVWTAGMIVGLALLATQGLGYFGSHIAPLITEPDAALRVQAVEHRVFARTFAAAALVLAVAFALAWGLRSTRANEFLVSPYEGLGE
ncbi:MAG TPA: MFS transporter [Dehalococcoidia bacterium]|nr:MFS transporter [Dehalococcoidia bacterium]